MKKKLLYLMLVLVTVVTCIVALGIATSAAVTKDGVLPFVDVKDSYWYADAVEFCYVNDVIDGMNEYTFGGTTTLTRAQFVTMLANIDGADTGSYSTSKFTDVKSSHWFYGAVSWAYTKNLIPSEIITNNKFQPNAVIDRETLSAIMYNYMYYKSYDVYVDYYCLYDFDDYDDVSDWAWYGMRYMVSSGLITGFEDCTLRPMGSVTRAQIVTILMRFLDEYHYGEKCSTYFGHTYNAATCTESKTCTYCGMKSGLPLGHFVVNSHKCNSTSQSKCTRCGYWVSGNMMPHDYAAATCGKAETCKNCSVTRRAATGKHSWWSATCTNPKMCKVCYKTEGKALGHDWKRADCVNPKRCGRYGCNVTEGKPLTTTKQHSWWAATCTNPKMCKVCYTTSGSALGHSWKAADCTAPKTCTRCKLTEGKALTTTKQHSWWSATCTNPKMCKVCYKTEGSALGHNYKAATCTAAKTCTRCKGTTGSALGHDWKAATCSTPKTCKRCNTKSGSPLSSTGTHQWWAATCTNPKMCKICYTSTGSPDTSNHAWTSATCTSPKTCTRCYKTSGSALGHNYSAATCTKPKTCTRCSATSGNALGHTTYNGTCSRCNTYVSVADQCKLYLYDDDLPKLLIDYDWSGYVDEAVYVTNVQYKFTAGSDGTVDLDLYFEGYKYYDDDGSYYSSSFEIAWKLYDQYGYVVETDSAYTPGICEGESFRNVKDYAWDLEPGVYYLDLLNVD